MAAVVSGCGTAFCLFGVIALRCDPDVKFQEFCTVCCFSDQRLFFRQFQFQLFGDIYADFLLNSLCILFGSDDTDKKIVSVTDVLQSAEICIHWIFAGDGFVYLIQFPDAFQKGLLFFLRLCLCQLPFESDSLCAQLMVFHIDGSLVPTVKPFLVFSHIFVELVEIDIG